MKQLASLRKKYPRFIYQKYSYRLKGKELRTSFRFKIEPDIKFKARINIKNVSAAKLKKIGDRQLNNFVFHLGLMEIPTYWKTTCSPEIMIRAGVLDKEQIAWWKELIIKGMGQFFYENKIDFREKGFLSINSNPSLTAPSLDIFSGELKDRYLVPLGGGKDSIVTLEKLKKKGKQANCFLLNPGKAAKKVVKAARIKEPVVAERKIDPFLLQLNRQGYLNGHTPFTAVLSFLSVFCSALFNYKHIAFSNEKSANEGNVRYLGRTINHQYSKSSDFERRFREYCRKYLSKETNYFSYLRKYTELEIAKMFAKYPQYFSAFSSCNQGLKTGERWCGNCPKCLFVYATLYPYLERKQLKRIFGQDIFENKKLVPVMKALIGKGREKPFECVGTYQESRQAFGLSLAKAKKTGSLPYLLQKFNAIK